MKTNKKYRIMLIGVILLVSGSTIATILFLSANNLMFENVVFNSKPIAPGESITGTFTLNQIFDVKLYIGNHFDDKTLEVVVYDEMENQIFKTQVNADIEEDLQKLEAGTYKISIKNLADDHAMVTVAASEIDGVDRGNIFFNLAYVGIAGLIIAVAGFFTIIIGLVKFLLNRKQN